ncbi:MAG: DUF721 domain-containing protein [Rikenellaceae bacterium]
MQRTAPIKIGDLITQIISSDKVAQQGLLEARALGYWREVVGDSLAEATQKITLRDGRIYVVFSSSSARNEFFLRRTEIKNGINEKVGVKVVKFISV